MQYYLLQQRAEQDLLKSFFKAAADAEATREGENIAAANIVAGWKRYKKKKGEEGRRRNAVAIQKVFRGHKGRLLAEEKRIEKIKNERKMLYDHFATGIQRIFRGFYVRKWVADYYSRKRYLAEIEQKSEAVLDACNKHREEQEAEFEREKKQRYMESFTKLSSRMLYIASTSSIPGVLSSKQIDPALHETFGTTAEGALRMHRARKFKPTLPARSLAATTTTTTNVTIKDEGPRKPFVGAVRSDNTFTSRPLRIYAGYSG